jgi:hypothetical protein
MRAVPDQSERHRFRVIDRNKDDVVATVGDYANNHRLWDVADRDAMHRRASKNPSIMSGVDAH